MQLQNKALSRKLVLLCVGNQNVPSGQAERFTLLLLPMDAQHNMPSALEYTGVPVDISPSREGVPLYLSPVEAGFPSPADDYVEKKLDLHEYLVRNEAATFFLRAHGESMLGAGIHDGDLLIVDRSLEAKHNRIVIAALDGELTVKRLVRRRNQVFLAPENAHFAEIDITEREGVHIWGVVSYVIHKLS